MIAQRWPQVGDPAVELRRGAYSPDSIGSVVHVKDITKTLVVTSDGGRYNRDGLFPVHEGRQSARRLVPPSDDRVLCAQGRALLEKVAGVARNLSAIDRKDPMDALSAFSRLVAFAAGARTEFVGLMHEASKAEQESDR